MLRLIVTSTVCVLAALFLPFGQMASAETISCEPEFTDQWIPYGTTVYCAWEEPGESDWFRFSGSSGDDLRIDLWENSAGDPTVCLEVYGPDGQPILDPNPTCAPTGVSVAPVLAADGMHTIKTWGGQDYPYLLQLACPFGPCYDEPAPPSTLGYTAVEPCRIVDTRYGTDGTFSAGETQSYHVYGDVSAQNGAGGSAPADYPTVCPSPVGEPSAVHLNVTVVPRNAVGQKGFATVWPWNSERPNSSWINYEGGNANIANAGSTQTTVSTDSLPDISVYSFREIDLIIDVTGYYSD
jgi:hypothetical protein